MIFFLTPFGLCVSFLYNLNNAANLTPTPNLFLQLSFCFFLIQHVSVFLPSSFSVSPFFLFCLTVSLAAEYWKLPKWSVLKQQHRICKVNGSVYHTILWTSVLFWLGTIKKLTTTAYIHLQSLSSFSASRSLRVSFLSLSIFSRLSFPLFPSFFIFLSLCFFPFRLYLPSCGCFS